MITKIKNTLISTITISIGIIYVLLPIIFMTCSLFMYKYLYTDGTTWMLDINEALLLLILYTLYTIHRSSTDYHEKKLRIDAIVYGIIVQYIEYKMEPVTEDVKPK